MGAFAIWCWAITSRPSWCCPILVMGPSSLPFFYGSVVSGNLWWECGCHLVLASVWNIRTKQGSSCKPINWLQHTIPPEVLKTDVKFPYDPRTTLNELPTDGWGRDLNRVLFYPYIGVVVPWTMDETVSNKIELGLSPLKFWPHGPDVNYETYNFQRVFDVLLDV